MSSQTVSDLIEYVQDADSSEGYTQEQILGMPILVCDGQGNMYSTVLSTYVSDGCMCIDVGE